jgi:hypothetical protein
MSKIGYSDPTNQRIGQRENQRFGFLCRYVEKRLFQAFKSFGNEEYLM